MLDHVSTGLLIAAVIVGTLLVFFGLYKLLSLFLPWSEARWGVLFLVSFCLLRLLYSLATTTMAEDMAIVHIFNLSITLYSLLTFVFLFVALWSFVMRYIRN